MIPSTIITPTPKRRADQKAGSFDPFHPTGAIVLRDKDKMKIEHKKMINIGSLVVQVGMFPGYSSVDIIIQSILMRLTTNVTYNTLNNVCLLKKKRKENESKNQPSTAQKKKQNKETKDKNEVTITIPIGFRENIYLLHTGFLNPFRCRRIIDKHC